MTSKKLLTPVAADILYHQAFDNAVQANIITTVSSGKILIVNSAACKLLGYSERELLIKSRKDIFDINESSFKKMLKQRSVEGKSTAVVTAIKKNGRPLACEITSAVFIDAEGIQKAITTITDMRQSILKQKKIDAKKEKIVAGDIIVAQAKSDSRLAENEEWIKNIAKTSYDVMWDWDIASGEIYVGDSIKEAFGYNVQNNTVKFTDFLKCLLAEERERVEKKLSKMIASAGKSWNDTFVFKHKDGSEAPVICRASIIRDDNGKAIHLIGALQDISKLHELEKKLEEQSDKLFLADKLSFDVIWDWNIVTNELYIGEWFEELFGYPVKNNKGNMTSDWGNYLHPEDKAVVEKGLSDAIASTVTHWEHAYRFIRADGSIASIFNRASIIRHSDGKAYRMIGAMQDISKQIAKEEKLKQVIAAKGKLLNQYDESFKFILNSSSDVLFDFDLVTNKVEISDAYEKEFGYKITGNIMPAEYWISNIHPGDEKAVMKDYSRVFASEGTEWKYSYRLLRTDNSVANVIVSGFILRNAAGKAYRMIGSIRDTDKKKVLEEKLVMEIELKEQQIAEAMEDAKATERSEIGKELHDNVNQLLGVSKLYLDMAKQGGEKSELYLSRSSEYTLDAIEEIRKLTKGLTTDIIMNLGLCEAVENIIKDAMQVNPVKISCAMKSFREDSVSHKFKLNVYRVIQEQLNNILKHAKAVEVAIKLSQTKKSIVLTISDNGIGFDTGENRNGIGVANINSRAASYNGTADFVSHPGHGCKLTVTFPVSDALNRQSA